MGSMHRAPADADALPFDVPGDDYRRAVEAEADELAAAVMLRAVAGLPTRAQRRRIADLRAGRAYPQTSIDDALDVTARA